MIYQILGIAAPIFVPIAPVIFFGWRVYTAVIEMTQRQWLAVPAGALTALGLEAVGILAGHVGMMAWKRGDNRTAVIAAAIMCAYVGIGTLELWGSVGAVVFWIAPLVYVLVALQELLKQDTRQSDAILAFDLKQRALDNDVARKLKYDRAMAKVRSGSQNNSQTANSSHTSGTAVSGKVYECACGWSTNKGSRSYNAHKRHCKK